MQRRFQVIKCNPNFYKGLILQWNVNGNRIFKYQINPSSFTKRDTLWVNSVSVNEISISNKMVQPASVQKVSLNQYDAIELVFTPLLNAKAHRTICWTYKVGTNYTVNLEATTQMMNSHKKHNSLNKNPVHKLPVVTEQGTPIKKAYWQKHSDLARSQFSRFLRYNELTGIFTDLQLKRKYQQKFKIVKFLKWKLQMSKVDLKQQPSGSYFTSCLNNSLMNCLVILGFYATYTVAQKAIQTNKILVNGQVISDQFYQMQIQDTVTLVPAEWSQSKNSKVLSNLSNYVQLLPHLSSFIILKLINSDVMQLNTLQQSIQNSKFEGKILDPLNSIFIRNANLVNRSL